MGGGGTNTIRTLMSTDFIARTMADDTNEPVVDAVYRIRETLQTVHTGKQDVLKATVFQLRQHAQPELCAFIFGQPHAL